MLRRRLIGLLGLLGLLLALSAVPAAAVEEGFFDANGVRIRYITSGSGEPVILLHGFAMSSAEKMWVKNPLFESKIIRELDPEFRVIAMEFRGHGQSGKPTDPKAYGREMSEDVIRLMDHLKVKRAHVVGYSLGAAVAGKLLVTHPERLLSVTFGGGAPVFQPSQEAIASMNLLADSLERSAGVGPLIPLIAPADSPLQSPELAAKLGQALVVGQDQPVLAAVVRGIADLEVTEAQLRENKVPVTFIYGDREGEARGRIKSVTRIMTKAKVTEIAGGDHFNTVATVKFRKAVHTFLKKPT